MTHESEVCEPQLCGLMEVAAFIGRLRSRTRRDVFPPHRVRVWFQRCSKATFEHDSRKKNFAQCQRNAPTFLSWRQSCGNLYVFISYVACPSPVASSRAFSFHRNVSSCGSRHVCLPQASNNYPDHLPATQIQMERPWHPCALPMRQKKALWIDETYIFHRQQNLKKRRGKRRENLIHVFLFSVKMFLMDYKCV